MSKTYKDKEQYLRKYEEDEYRPRPKKKFKGRKKVNKQQELEDLLDENFRLGI